MNRRALIEQKVCQLRHASRVRLELRDKLNPTGRWLIDRSINAFFSDLLDLDAAEEARQALSVKGAR